MRTRRILLDTLVLATIASAAPGEAPVAVSPGDDSGLAAIEHRCPTFSWGEMDGASNYELVVYRLGEESEEPVPVLQRSFAGSVTSWTPALGSCLVRGGRYAWSLRAVGKQTASEWSAPSLFEVAAGPSETELEDALEVVRRHLAEQRSSRRTIAGSTGAPAATAPRTGSSIAASAPEPLSHAGSGNGIMVDGVLAETKADPPCWQSAGDPDQFARFVDCGNGTVHDTVTNLLWLKNANCLYNEILGVILDDGLRNWWDANQFAAGLDSGRCGLTDHSQPGDWRLATKEEWESLMKPDCTNGPEIYGKGGAGICYQDSPWAMNAVESGYWSSTWVSYIGGAAWRASLIGGTLGESSPVNTNFVWPVRGGQ